MPSYLIGEKKSRVKNPAKFNREASRLGDVGPINRPLGSKDPSLRHCARVIDSAQVQGGVSCADVFNIVDDRAVNQNNFCISPMI